MAGITVTAAVALRRGVGCSMMHAYGTAHNCPGELGRG